MPRVPVSAWPWQRLPSPEVPLAQQEKIKVTFEQLVVVDHPNIVKVHKYWLDVKESKAQVSYHRARQTGEPMGLEGWAQDKGLQEAMRSPGEGHWWAV